MDQCNDVGAFQPADPMPRELVSFEALWASVEQAMASVSQQGSPAGSSGAMAVDSPAFSGQTPPSSSGMSLDSPPSRIAMPEGGTGACPAIMDKFEHESGLQMAVAEHEADPGPFQHMQDPKLLEGPRVIAARGPNGSGPPEGSSYGPERRRVNSMGAAPPYDHPPATAMHTMGKPCRG